MLSNETIAELEALRAPREYGFIPELVQKRTELRKHKVPRELHEKVALMVTPQPLQIMEKVDPLWRKHSGVFKRFWIPEWCRMEGVNARGYMPASVIQYDLCHRLLLEINAFLRGEALPHHMRGAKLTYSEFFAACASKSGDASQSDALMPFPAHLAEQCGFGVFSPGQCLRQLALIIAVDKQYTDLPLDHGALLKEMRRCIDNESVQCSVLSEMHNAAAQRLIEYSRDSSRCFANARFLNLHELAMEPAADSGPHPAGERRKVETELAAQTALRRMVETLAEVLEQQGVNMTVFTPNQVAAMSVYYANLLAKRSGREARAQNGLARWCYGLPAFVSGEAIEPESSRRACLASQCLPYHYDASGTAQPVALERACQAIVAAPEARREEACAVCAAIGKLLLTQCAKRSVGVICLSCKETSSIGTVKEVSVWRIHSEV